MSGLFNVTDLVVVPSGEARMTASVLRERLGMFNNQAMTRLIDRNMASVLRFGELIATVAKNPSAQGGRPMKDYLLNEGQALYLSTRSETPVADEVRVGLVMLYMTHRKGQLPDMPAPKADPFDAMAGRAGHVRDHLLAIAAMPALARDATHLPIWSNGRRPNWWSNYELRAFLTESHRQMTLGDCCAQVRKRFGFGFSASTLQRYWAKLDTVVGPGRAA
jgi:hypothetical protein